MQYVSTRGGAAPLAFSDATLAGLAPDGGLFVPERYPVLAPEAFDALRGRPFEDVALAVLAPFATDIPEADLKADIDAAMASFGHPARTIASICLRSAPLFSAM